MNHPKKFNILHITCIADFSGGPRHVFTLLQHSSGTFNNYIACPKEEPFWEIFSKLCEKICEIPRQRFSFFYLYKLFIFTKVNQIACIHAHGKAAGLYARIITLLNKNKCIHTSHGIHIDRKHIFIKNINLLYEHVSDFLVDAFIFVSPSEKELANKLKIWKKKENHVISNGVNTITLETKELFNSEIRGKYSIPLASNVVCSIGRFDTTKNLIASIMIAEKLPKNIYWILVGDGQQRQKAELLVKEKKLFNIILTGFVSDPFKYLASSNIFLSTSQREGMPLAVLEALSMGLPIVASKIPGHIDIVSHGYNGYLFDNNNYDGAAKQIFNIFQNKKVYETFSKKSLEYYEARYTSEMMTENTEKIYCELIAS